MLSSQPLAASTLAPFRMSAPGATIGLVQPTVVAARTPCTSVAAACIPASATAATSGFPCGVSLPNPHSLILPLR